MKYINIIPKTDKIPDIATALVRCNGKWVLGEIEGENSFFYTCNSLADRGFSRFIENGKYICNVSFKQGERSYTVGVFFYEMDNIKGDIKLYELMPHDIYGGVIAEEIFEAVQGWLNQQTSADEMWDVYDENRQYTGRVHRRGELLPEGDYHTVVHVFVRNSKGQYLITKRAPNKGYPNIWECCGGSAVAGDTSLEAAVREIYEETGVAVSKEQGILVDSFRFTNAFIDCWLFHEDFNLSEVKLQEGETVDKRAATADEILELYRNGLFVPHEYLPSLLQKMKGL